MAPASSPTLEETLKAMLEWAARKQAEPDRLKFKEHVKRLLDDSICSDSFHVPPALAEHALNELCFMLALCCGSKATTPTVRFDTICTLLVTTIGFGRKRASQSDVEAVMRALELVRLSEGACRT
jgi:hypothetical protein